MGTLYEKNLDFATLPVCHMRGEGKDPSFFLILKL